MKLYNCTTQEISGKKESKIIWRNHIISKTIIGVNSNGPKVVGICFLINIYKGSKRLDIKTGLTLFPIKTDTHDIITSNITRR